MKIDQVLNAYRRGDADKRMGLCLYYRAFRDEFSGIEQDDPMDLEMSRQETSPQERMIRFEKRTGFCNKYFRSSSASFIQTEQEEKLNMNQVIETIMKRRSVRLYESKPVPREILQTLIDAGNAAPTGGNAQSWRFVVVENKTFKNTLMSLAIPRYKKWMEKASKELSDMRKEIDAAVSDPIYYDAPAVIFVIGSGMTRDLDTPMVCENMMIAARSLNVGSCWVYFGQLPLDDQEVRNALELQEGEKVYGPILLGYPKGGEFPASPQKKKPVIKWI